MPDDIVYQRMRPGDKRDVLAFLAKSYPDNPRHANPAFWSWHFEQPPAAPEDSPSVWLAKSGDRIAGQMAGLPVNVNVNGETRTAMWALDFIVDPDFRRRGIGKRLALAAEADYPFLLGVNTDQQHAPALLEGLGWKKVTRIPRFHRILFPGNALKELERNRPLRSTINALYRPLRGGTPNSSSKYELRSISGFGSEFDAFWAEAGGQWTCSIRRCKDLLAWQFEKQPGKHFDAIGCYDGGKLAGYAVVFFREPSPAGNIAKAAITDICYSPENSADIVDALLHSSVKLAVERRAGGLVTDTLDPLLQERLKRHRFWPIDSPLQLMVKAPAGLEAAYDPRNWFLTRADSDISIFEHPNAPLPQ